MYIELETKVPWSNTTGGVVVQEVNTVDGVWVRKGSADDTTWGAWYKSYDNQNKPNLASSDVLNSTMDYIADGATRFGAAQAGADVTHAHVLTVAVSASSYPALSTTVQTAIPGLGWSLTAASTADVYNIMAQLCFSCPTAGGAVTVAIVVDGNYTTPYATTTYYCQAANQMTDFALFGSVAGLTAGSHTIALYARAVVANTVVSNGTYAICQRIY